MNYLAVESCHASPKCRVQDGRVVDHTLHDETLVLDDKFKLTSIPHIKAFYLVDRGEAHSAGAFGGSTTGPHARMIDTALIVTE